MKYGVPLLVWLLAAGCTAGAVQQWHRVSEAAERASSRNASTKPSVHEVPLSLAEYQTIGARVAVYGSVQLSTAAQGIVVTAGELGDYAAWRLTLDRIMLDSPGLSWRVDYLCSGQCDDGSAHRASLTAVRRQIVL